MKRRSTAKKRKSHYQDIVKRYISKNLAVPRFANSTLAARNSTWLVSRPILASFTSLNASAPPALSGSGILTILLMLALLDTLCHSGGPVHENETEPQNFPLLTGFSVNRRLE